MWNDMAKKCIQHLKPDDFIYVSGCLVSYTKPNENGNDYLNHKVCNAEYLFIFPETVIHCFEMFVVSLCISLLNFLFACSA